MTLRAQDRDAVTLVKVFSFQWYTNDHLKLRPQLKVIATKGKRITLAPASKKDSVTISKILKKFDLTLEKMFLDFTRLENVVLSESFWADSDQLKNQGQTIANRRYGQWKEFSRAGTLTEIKHYDVEGRKDSLWISFDSKGNRIKQIKYRNLAMVSYGEWYSDGAIKLQSEGDNAKEYYPDGNLLAEGKFNLVLLASAKNGLWTSYFKDGRVKSKIEYRNGKISGQHLEWHANGQQKLISFQHYTEGGKHLEWFPNGQLKEEAYFSRRAYRDSVYRIYNSNGKVLVEKYFEDNLLNGPATTYYENGDLEKFENYERGKLDSISTWYEGGSLASYYNFSREQWSEYFKNGQLKKHYASEFNKNRKTGQYKEWFQNGQLRSHGSFRKTDSTGQWTIYHENGKRHYITSYTRGRKKGDFVSWYDNGQQHEIGKYRFANKAHGKWVAYYPDGKRKYKGEYENGHKIGKWLYWDAIGKKRREKH